MQNIKDINPTEDEYKEDVVGDAANHASVLIYSKSNYRGAQAVWSSTWPYYKIANGDDSTLDGNLGSLIVLRGQCEATTSIGGIFPAPDDTKTYYDANAGMNNQGCFPELGSNTNRITALRTQRDDIIRPTGTPYLVLRTTPSGGKITDGDAIILLSDQPSISAFTCECAIAVGSTTGEWFLFDEENYQGRITKVTVGGGSEHNIGNGFYSFDENVIVRSARMAPPDAETGPWMRYSPNYCKTFRVVNKYDYTITLKTIWEDGSHNEEDFPNDDFIDYTIDYNQKALTRNGKKIAQISLNGGYSAEDIYTGGNTVFYSTYRDQSGHAIFTFDTYEYVNWIVESSGVDGGPAAKLWLDNATVPEFLTMTIRRA